MRVNNLNCAFNPSNFTVSYPKNYEEENLLDEEKKKKENDLFEEVITELKSDMSRLGMDCSYSSEILLREIAMNILLMNRIKLQVICKSLLRDRKLLRKDYVMSKNDRNIERTQKSISYDLYLGEEEVHPLFERFLPKLQKQINEGLKQLGLLPQQQVERQKIVLVEKLKKRLIDLRTNDQQYTVDATIQNEKTL